MHIINILGMIKFHRVMAQLRAGTYDSRTIDLSNCGLHNKDAQALFAAIRDYPDQATEVNNIDLSHNHLTVVEVVGVENIMQLDLSHNQIAKFRAAKLPYLCELLLNNNQLKSVQLAHLTTLQKLNVAYNLLSILDVATLRNLHTLSTEQKSLHTILFSKAVLDQKLSYDPEGLNNTTLLFIDAHAHDYPEIVKSVTTVANSNKLRISFSKTCKWLNQLIASNKHNTNSLELTARIEPESTAIPAELVFANAALSQYVTSILTSMLHRDKILDKATKVFAYLTAATRAPDNFIAGWLREYLNDDLIKMTDPVLNDILEVARKQNKQNVIDSAVGFMSGDYGKVEKAVVTQFMQRLQNNQKLTAVIKKLEVNRSATQPSIVTDKPKFTPNFYRVKRANSTQVAFREDSVEVITSQFKL